MRSSKKDWSIQYCIILAVILLLILFAFLSRVFYVTNSLQETCSIECRVSLVESIPEHLDFPNNSVQFPSTYEAWKNLTAIARSSIEIASFYWSIRSSDLVPHPSSNLGEDIFQDLLKAGTTRNITLRIAQNNPSTQNPNADTEFLAQQNAAEVRSLDFAKLMGGGVLHTKFWIVDRKHFYVGSANMDWRSLTQVKEMGIVFYDCPCLADDLAKIFNVYWYLGGKEADIPAVWPKELETSLNMKTPLNVSLNNETYLTYLTSSPPPFSPKGRTDDILAILDVMKSAKKFIYIAVMDYFPLMIYSPKVKFWPIIDDALRSAAIDRRVKIRLLISRWNHSRSSEDYFLKSLTALDGSYRWVQIEVKRFVVPTIGDESKIPFARVNHNKYMVTDETALIGTSNWSGDYFTDTAGVSVVLRSENQPASATVRKQLQDVFERDWFSNYSTPM